MLVDNQNGHHTATISTANTSTYDRINRAGGKEPQGLYLLMLTNLMLVKGNYDRFNQHSATVTSVASMYSSLNMKGNNKYCYYCTCIVYYCMLIDDYQRLDDCTIRHNSQGTISIHDLDSSTCPYRLPTK